MWTNRNQISYQPQSSGSAAFGLTGPYPIRDADSPSVKSGGPAANASQTLAGLEDDAHAGRADHAPDISEVRCAVCHRGALGKKAAEEPVRGLAGRHGRRSPQRRKRWLCSRALHQRVPNRNLECPAPGASGHRKGKRRPAKDWQGPCATHAYERPSAEVDPEGWATLDLEQVQQRPRGGGAEGGKGDA